MHLQGQGQLLRIFISEGDTWKGKPLYEAIIFKSRELRLAGATVTKGIMGYGASSHIHTAKVLRLSEHLPLIIEIVDTEEKIQLILPYLDEVVKEGLVTLEMVRVFTYR